MLLYILIYPKKFCNYVLIPDNSQSILVNTASFWNIYPGW